MVSVSLYHARVVVPGLPPSANNLYGTSWRTGRRHLSRQGRAWHQAVAEACLVARVHSLEGRKVRLSLVVAFAGLSLRRDVSNAVKCLEDALAAALDFDDRYISALSASRVLPAAGAEETRVWLTELAVEAPDRDMGTAEAW